MLPLLLRSLLAQQSVRDPALAARIQDLFHTALAADSDAKQESAEAQMKAIFAKDGLPTIRDVGDDASYKFVMLACSSDSPDFQKLALRTARAAVRNREIPLDAAAYCDAHIRHETLNAEAKKRRPTNAPLHDRIEQIYRSDQAVRDKEGFDGGRWRRLIASTRKYLKTSSPSMASRPTEWSGRKHQTTLSL
jgi:hypothetical protein